jgi:hypothetical protein
VTSANIPDRAVRLCAGIVVIINGASGNASAFANTFKVLPISALGHFSIMRGAAEGRSTWSRRAALELGK